MPRYLFSNVYVAPDQVAEYTPIPASNYDRTGYAVNWFPEQFALKSEHKYIEQALHPPYGPVGQPVSPETGAG